MCFSSTGLLRLLRKAHTAAPIMSTAATRPATTPPAIAPLLIDGFIIICVTVARGADVIAGSVGGAVVDVVEVLDVFFFGMTVDENAAAEDCDVSAPGLTLIV